MAEAPEHDFAVWILVASIIFLIWAFLFAALRTWAKTKRSLQWALHDNFFTVAFILSIGESVCVYIAVHYGFAKPPPTLSSKDDLHMEKAVYASQVLYILSIGVSKISTILFLRGLVRDIIHKRICHAVTALVVCWAVASTFVVALRGSLSTPWSVLYNHELYQRWLGVESSGLVLELIMWAVSIGLCWSLHMPHSKRLKVVGIFGSRMLLIPIIIARLHFLSRAYNTSSLNAIALSQVFTQGAMQYSLMAECMTCLKPFLNPFHTAFEYSADDTAQRRRGLHPISNNPRREAYTSITTSNTSSKFSEGKVPERTISQRLGLDPLDHAQGEELRRGDNISFRAQVERDVTAVPSPGDLRLESHRSSSAILQTTTVSVNHDDVIVEQDT